MTKLVDISMPDDGSSATLSHWLFAVGDLVRKDDALVELETDKVNVEIPSPANGTLVEITKQPGQSVAAGEVIGQIRLEVRTGNQATSVAPAQHPVDNRLSPAVRRLLAEHHLEPAQICGSGRDGRITKQDVLALLANASSLSPPPMPAAVPAVTAQKRVPQRGDLTAKLGKTPAPPSSGTSRIVPLDTMRKKIAAHMVSSLLETAPHVTSIFEMDMGAIIKHRAAHKSNFASDGVNLTFTAYFVMASVEAIKAVPEVNSRWHDHGIEIFSAMNIGVGTALGDRGLIVPVIHNAQNMDLRNVAARLSDVTTRARDGKLSPADVKGGSFTISNHGVSGSLIATPIIINQPQSAILGIGKLQKRVMVVERDGQDAIQVRPMCYLTLSIDHRSLDAWHTNTFLSRFVEVIEGWQ